MKHFQYPLKEWERNTELIYKDNNKFVYNWFSNFEYSPIIIDGQEYPSVENYYQALKTTNLHEREVIRTSTPGQAKRLGKKVTLREDWEDIKVEIMYRALKVKWSLPEWKSKLLATNDEILVEWNNWGDKIWGATIDDNKGKNILGILLMQIREELK